MEQRIEKVFWMNPDDLVPYAMNAKLHPPEQIDRLANGIKAFGWTQPIVIDKDNVIVIGHGRLLAAKQLMLDKVPCIRQDDLAESEINACRLEDNKTNESDWDFAKLEEELAQLAIDGIDMDQFGFTTDEMPENLDAEEGYDSNAPISCKLTFDNYVQYNSHETEIKAFAESIGATFSVVKT